MQGDDRVDHGLAVAGRSKIVTFDDLNDVSEFEDDGSEEVSLSKRRHHLTIVVDNES